MNEKLKSFLLSIGLKDTDISGLQDEASTIDVKQLTENFKATQRDLMKNDPTLVSELSDAGFGKAAGSIQTVLKRVFGLTTEEINSVPTDISGSARWERMSQIGIEKLKKSSQSTAEELQTENQNLKAELLDLKEKKIPEIQAQADGKIKEFHVKNKLSELVGKHELIVDKKVAELLVNNHITESGYRLEMTDKGIEILTKDGLRPQNADRTKNLTAEEIVAEVLNTSKVIKQSNASAAGSTGNNQSIVKDIPDDVKTKYPGMVAGLEKAKANLDQMKGNLPKAK
jgi:hypothetical protein